MRLVCDLGHGQEIIAAKTWGGFPFLPVFGGWFRSASQAWIGWLKDPLGPVWFPVFQQALFACAAWGVLYWLYRRKVFFKL